MSEFPILEQSNIFDDDQTLDSIWKKGIPNRFRETLWPFTIQNKLEISKVLYKISLDEGLKVLDQLKTDTKVKNLTQLQLSKIKLDAEQAYFTIGHSSGGLYTFTFDQLFNVVIAFVVYRPDIGYKRGMAYLVGMFMLYMPEAQTFRVFTNFVHQHYFLTLFSGQHDILKLRIDLFNNFFRYELPDLYYHFETLDLTSDMFLIDYMLTLFSKSLSNQTVARIIDNFILQSETYVIMTTLAILTYFQAKFLKQSHHQIIKTLLNLKDENIDTSLLF